MDYVDTIRQGVPTLGASNKGGMGKTSYFRATRVNIPKTVRDTVKVTINHSKSHMRCRLDWHQDRWPSTAIRSNFRRISQIWEATTTKRM